MNRIPAKNPRLRLVPELYEPLRQQVLRRDGWRCQKLRQNKRATRLMGMAVRKHPSRCPLKAGFLMYRRARLCFVNGLRYGARACLDSRQQTHNPSQGLPGRLVHCRVRPDEVADHLPGSNVEVADGWWSHSQGD